MKPAENNLMTFAQQMVKMNDDELVAVIAMAQEAIEAHRKNRRKAEIIVELNDLLTELIEMDCGLYFVSGQGVPVEMVGTIYDTGDDQIFIT